MVGEAFASLSAIKTAFDMAKGLQDIHDAAARDRAVIELQKEILAAQAAQFSLVEQVSSLKEQMAKFETWDTEKQKYELKALVPNVMAYAIKESMRGIEPHHYLCANCYSNGKKSFLNQTVRGTRVDRFHCNTCGEDLTIDKDVPHTQKYATPRGGPDGWMGR